MISNTQLPPLVSWAMCHTQLIHYPLLH